jgi:hypothetical protein
MKASHRVGGGKMQQCHRRRNQRGQRREAHGAKPADHRRAAGKVDGVGNAGAKDQRAANPDIAGIVQAKIVHEGEADSA